MAAPALDATDCPARTLPVRLTARIRRSSMTVPVVWMSVKTFAKSPSGYPAAENSSSRANAQPGTLGACLSRTALPAVSVGAAKRTTCQNGKFQGMMPRTTPRG